jgi:mono/diheme cytochrome c family protein
MKKTMVLVWALAGVLCGGLCFAQDLPLNTSSEFSGSGNCATCHTSDGVSNTENGVDISNPTLWRSTMMANSAKDPLWRAKVSAEVAELPQYQEAIEATCTRCHAPLGREQAMHDGAGSYSIAEMAADPLALDGVSCTLCHQMEPDNFGLPESYSGNFGLDDEHQIYGPFTAPLTGPMQSHTGFTPVYGAHVTESELCATCHTLFTASVDEEGELSGSFPEQTPYLEWKNSTFNESGVSCQACHMPMADTAQDISTMPPWHTALRAPFAKHEFAGANAFMLNILKDNSEALGVTATSAQFDSTLARTQDMLANQTLGLLATYELSADTLAVDLRVENHCGHKLPTGIPLRRLWIRLQVTDQDGITVFDSGRWDEQGEVVGLDAGYEPHHDLITRPDQVQIYEPVMGDVYGNPTFTLLRANRFLKDNRLPPMGFNSSHSAYDSTAIYGLALEDPDFNRDQDVEGNGADQIHYRIPVMGTGPFTVTASAHYQTITPRFQADLESYDTPEVQHFAGMYAAADKTPSLLGRLEFTAGSMSAVPEDGLPSPLRLNQNVPNPFNPATVISYELRTAGPVQVTIHDVSGRLVRRLFSGQLAAGMHHVNWNGTDDRGGAVASGIYLYRVQSGAWQESRAMSLVR